MTIKMAMAYLDFTFVCILCILLNVNLEISAGKLPRLAGDDVLQMSYTGRPICAYFKSAGTSPKYEELLSDFLKTKVAIKCYSKWTFGVVNIADIQQVSPPPNLFPRLVPSLQCDIGLELPLELLLQNKSLGSLKKWFKHVLRRHSSQPRIVTTSSELENAILYNNNGITVLLIAETAYFDTMKSVAKEVEDIGFDVPPKILLTRRDYVDSWKEEKSFRKLKYPAALFFNYEAWTTEKSFTYVLQGQQEVSVNAIQLAVKAVLAKFVFLDEDRFVDEILNTKYQLPPKLLFVFSYSNSNSLKYFLTFERLRKQLECQNILLEFRIMDIGKRENLREIQVFHEVFNEPLSANQLFPVLVENRMLDAHELERSNDFHCIKDDDNHEMECANFSFPRGVCTANKTNSMNENYLERNSLPKKFNKKRKKKVIKRKVGSLTVLTDHDWYTVIEASRFSTLTKRLKRSDSPALSLVFFIIKKCRYCEIIMPQIEKLSQTSKRFENAAVYLVNCSLSPKICENQNVQGFPSLKLFRSLSSHLSGCAPDNIQQQYIALDYHRPIEPMDLILEWLSKSSLSSVKKTFLFKNIPKQIEHDVYLVGTVITRTQALRFLPVNSHNKWYTYTCFQTACELLFGKAVCYVIMTKDFGLSDNVRKTKNKDLFLIKLELFRSDGVSAKIFELGVSLEVTMHNEQDSELHKFHNVHSYSLKKRFRCEDSHSKCTEFIVRFVKDHSRLPITHLSYDGFHTINRLFSDGTGRSEELPIVVVLAYKENMTKHSSYSAEITRAAYELYRHVIFASLDVDEYPWWARQFVPRNYDATQLTYTSDLEYVSPLYHYPRLCIVKMSDHHQAAFLPSLESMESAKNIRGLLGRINAKDIVKFVKRYLQNPQELLVKTEEF